MAMLLFLIVISIYKCTCSTDTSESLYSTVMKRRLEYLCPGIDFCNTTVPFVRPNERVNDDRFISCCRGCSCHKDCHYNLNCCFPGDVDDSVAVTNSSVNGSNTHTSSTHQRLASGSRQGPVIRPKISSRNARSNHPSLPIKECVYAQTGTPLDDWLATVPAYVMVTKPPHEGCRVPQQDNAGPCSLDTGEPWGDLFPVYSEKRGEIYINERCARCHGVTDYIPWLQLLVCNTWDLFNSRTIPMSEHLSFLDQKRLSSKCYITYRYQELAVMMDNRCFPGAIHTCKYTTSDELFSTQEVAKMTASEITDACYSDLNAPVYVRAAAYRNVFCALCNMHGFRFTTELLCFNTIDTSRTFGTRLTYLLDTSSITRQDEGKGALVAPYPEACMRNGTNWVCINPLPNDKIWTVPN